MGVGRFHLHTPFRGENDGGHPRPSSFHGLERSEDSSAFKFLELRVYQACHAEALAKAGHYPPLCILYLADITTIIRIAAQR